MDKKLKTKWLKALRSGKIPQARGALYDNGAMCCIGVLCHVQGASVRYLKSHNSTLILPKYCRQLDMSDWPAKGVLAAMNDGNGCKPKTFAQIADYIEQNL